MKAHDTKMHPCPITGFISYPQQKIFVDDDYITEVDLILTIKAQIPIQ